MRFGLDEARDSKASQSGNAICDYCWKAKCHSERNKTEQQAKSSEMQDKSRGFISHRIPGTSAALSRSATATE
jgi:hypothetical protein